MSTKHSSSGDGSFLVPSLDVLKEVAHPTDPTPAPARHGKLGSCAACKQSIASHFDTAGRFLGCLAVPVATTFVLVPVTDTDGGEETTTSSGSMPATRRATRLRRRATPKARRLDISTLSDHRQRVLQAILNAGKGWALAAQIASAASLPNGSVQQVCAWLEQQGLIEAEEDPNKPVATAAAAPLPPSTP